MFSFVFPEKCSFSGRIGSHNTVVEIYSISTNAVICVFASVVLYSSVEIATFGVTYVYNGPVFIGELICARLSGDVPYSFRVSKSVPCIYYRHNTLLHIFWSLSLALWKGGCQYLDRRWLHRHIQEPHVAKRGLPDPR